MLWLGVAGVLGVDGVLDVESLPQPITHKSTINGGIKAGGLNPPMGGITTLGSFLVGFLTWFSAKNGELIKVNIVVIAISFFIINPVNFNFSKLLNILISYCYDLSNILIKEFKTYIYHYILMIFIFPNSQTVVSHYAHCLKNCKVIIALKSRIIKVNSCCKNYFKDIYLCLISQKFDC